MGGDSPWSASLPPCPVAHSIPRSRQFCQSFQESLSNWQPCVGPSNTGVRIAENKGVMPLLPVNTISFRRGQTAQSVQPSHPGAERRLTGNRCALPRPPILCSPKTLAVLPKRASQRLTRNSECGVCIQGVSQAHSARTMCRRIEMKAMKLFAALVVCSMASSAQAGLFGVFKSNHGCGCSVEPTCCAPVEASCCAPAACGTACEPTCCAPVEASCCAPAACGTACEPSCCAPVEASCCAPAACGTACEATCCAPADCCNDGCGCGNGCGDSCFKMPKFKMPKLKLPKLKFPKLGCGSSCGDSCCDSCCEPTCCAPVEASCCAPAACDPTCAAPCGGCN